MAHTGRVKWYDSERGFGIIVDQTGEDVFVHHTKVNEFGQGFNLHTGQTVSFELVQHQDVIPSAKNVHFVQPDREHRPDTDAPRLF
ncbi:MAG: cold shock domain-containing protein [Eubacteriales bacterium]